MYNFSLNKEKIRSTNKPPTILSIPDENYNVEKGQIPFTDEFRKSISILHKITSTFDFLGKYTNFDCINFTVNEKPLLPPEQRKIKTLSEAYSHENTKELLHLNNLIKTLFETTTDTWKETYEIMNKFVHEDTKNISFALRLLNIFFDKRPKYCFSAFGILHNLILNNPDLRPEINKFIHDFHMNNNFIESFFVHCQYPSNIFEDETNEDQNAKEEKEYEIPKNILYNNVAKNLIIEDDLEKFQQIIESPDKFDFNYHALECYEYLPGRYLHLTSLDDPKYDDFFSRGINIFEKYLLRYLPDFTIIDFAAFYGSIKCFKYFLLNNAKIFPRICKYAIAGGNFEIIQLLEQNNQNFSDCFDISVSYHRYEISDWILLHYPNQNENFGDALSSFNIQALTFYLFNCNDEIIKSKVFGYSIKNSLFANNYALPNFLIKNGSNVNYKYSISRFYDFQLSLLYFIFESPDLNMELVKYLIENGADPSECLGQYCMRKEIDYDFVKYLLSKGADPNIELILMFESEIKPIYQSVFSCLCENPLNKHDLIKLLLENGADIDKAPKDNPSPFYVICSNRDIPMDLVQLFIDKATNLNPIFQTKNHSKSLIYHLCKIYVLSTNQKEKERIIQIIKILIEKGADCNQGDLSPIYALSKSNKVDFDLVKYLLCHGAKINYGHFSVFLGLLQNRPIQKDNIEQFLSLGADINYGILSPITMLLREERPELQHQTMFYLINPNLDQDKDKNKLFKNRSKTPFRPFEKIGVHYIEKSSMLLTLPSRSKLPSCHESKTSNKTNQINNSLQEPIPLSKANLELIKFFIGKGANLNMESEGAKFDLLKISVRYIITTPLVALCSSPFVCIELLDLFLSHGADIKYVSQHLKTICQNEYITINLLTYLYDHGLDLTIEGEAIVTELCQRRYENNEELILFFCEHGVSPIVDSNSLDKILHLGDKILKYLSKSEQLKLFNYACRSDIVLLQKLLLNGLDPNTDYLLLRACSLIDVKDQAIIYLLCYGADVNQTKDSETPLSILCEHISKYTFSKVKILIQNGAKVDEKCIERARNIDESYVDYLRQYM